MAYQALVAFAAPARARSEIWRTAAGTVLIVGLYTASVIALLIAFRAALGSTAALRFFADFALGRSPGAVVLLLYTFLLLAAAVALTVVLLHRRHPATLVGPLRPTIRNFLRVALPLIALALLILPLTAMSDIAGRHLTLAALLSWLPLALPGLLIQVTAEELVFRGYLQQQLAARFRSALIWMLIPAALFGALHFAPSSYGQTAWIVVAWTALFGAFAADLTARTGNLGAAIGFHFANNFSSFFLVGVYGQLDGLALWNVVVDISDVATLLPLLAVDAAWMIAAWLLARVMLRV